MKSTDIFDMHPPLHAKAGEVLVVRRAQNGTPIRGTLTRLDGSKVHTCFKRRPLALPDPLAQSFPAVERYTEACPAKSLPLWLYRGALTHVQSIPEEDRKTLFAHKIHSDGPHPLEEAP